MHVMNSELNFTNHHKTRMGQKMSRQNSNYNDNRIPTFFQSGFLVLVSTIFLNITVVTIFFLFVFKSSLSLSCLCWWMVGAGSEGIVWSLDHGIVFLMPLCHRFFICGAAYALAKLCQQKYCRRLQQKIK